MLPHFKLTPRTQQRRNCESCLCAPAGSGEPVGQRRGCVAAMKGFMWASPFLSRSDSSEPNSMCTFSPGPSLWMAGSAGHSSSGLSTPRRRNAPAHAPCVVAQPGQLPAPSQARPAWSCPEHSPARRVQMPPPPPASRRAARGPSQ